jgi:hypothetical protein
MLQEEFTAWMRRRRRIETAAINEERHGQSGTKERKKLKKKGEKIRWSLGEGGKVKEGKEKTEKPLG